MLGFFFVSVSCTILMTGMKHSAIGENANVVG